MTCERCYKRGPSLLAWSRGSVPIEDAKRSEWPLLAYGWTPYADEAGNVEDPDHGTLYLEIAASLDAEEGAPGVEWLFGGVHRGGFMRREVQTRALGVRLPLIAEDVALESRHAGGVRFLEGGS